MILAGLLAADRLVCESSVRKMDEQQLFGWTLFADARVQRCSAPFLQRKTEKTNVSLQWAQAHLLVLKFGISSMNAQ